MHFDILPFFMFPCFSFFMLTVHSDFLHCSHLCCLFLIFNVFDWPCRDAQGGPVLLASVYLRSETVRFCLLSHSIWSQAEVSPILYCKHLPSPSLWVLEHDCLFGEFNWWASSSSLKLLVPIPDPNLYTSSLRATVDSGCKAPFTHPSRT